MTRAISYLNLCISTPACWLPFCPRCLFIRISIKGLLHREKRCMVWWFGWGNRSPDPSISFSNSSNTWVNQRTKWVCVSADCRVESFSQWRKDFCDCKHVVVICATHMTSVIWMMNTHLALWNRALISKLIWQMAAPQTLTLWKCVTSWRLCLLLASQKKNPSLTALEQIAEINVVGVLPNVSACITHSANC